MKKLLGIKIKDFSLKPKKPKTKKLPQTKTLGQAIQSFEHETASRQISNFRNNIADNFSQAVMGGDFLSSYINNYLKNFIALEPKKTPVFKLSRSQVAAQILQSLNKGKKNL